MHDHRQADSQVDINFGSRAAAVVSMTSDALGLASGSHKPRS
jgi:hypothetical protein